MPGTPPRSPKSLNNLPKHEANDEAMDVEFRKDGDVRMKRPR